MKALVLSILATRSPGKNLAQFSVHDNCHLIAVDISGSKGMSPARDIDQALEIGAILSKQHKFPYGFQTKEDDLRNERDLSPSFNSALEFVNCCGAWKCLLAIVGDCPPLIFIATVRKHQNSKDIF
jgi:hypothetical protein